MKKSLTLFVTLLFLAFGFTGALEVFHPASAQLLQQHDHADRNEAAFCEEWVAPAAHSCIHSSTILDTVEAEGLDELLATKPAVNYISEILPQLPHSFPCHLRAPPGPCCDLKISIFS